jgi:hypothetical protein
MVCKTTPSTENKVIKNFFDSPNVAEQNILILVQEKK